MKKYIIIGLLLSLNYQISSSSLPSQVLPLLPESLHTSKASSLHWIPCFKSQSTQTITTQAGHKRTGSVAPKDCENKAGCCCVLCITAEVGLVEVGGFSALYKAFLACCITLV